MLSKEKPLKVEEGLPGSGYDDHGRMITAEFETFYFVGVYVPNSGQEFKNLAKRKTWDAAMLKKLTDLDKLKPVICAGDLNVAHREKDKQDLTIRL